MNKSNIKIIFIDIDWTLFDDEKIKYPRSGIRAIKKARNNGVKVILCSARCYSSMVYINALNKIPNDGYICSAGAICYINDTYLIKELVDRQDIKKVCDYADKNDIILGMIGPQNCYLTSKPNELINHYFDSFLEPKPFIYHKYNNDEIITVVLFTEDKRHVENIKSLGLFVTAFFPNAYDVVSKQCDKGIAIKKCLQYLNINRDDALSIGDDIPDMNMFNETKYSIAMGNANDEVKQKATYITSNIRNRGIKKGLKYFKII